MSLVTLPFGDHDDAMIDEGIPRAIRWLQERGGPRAVASAAGQTTPAPRRPKPKQTPPPDSRPSAATNPFETARLDSPDTLPAQSPGASPGSEGGLDQLVQTIRSFRGDWGRCLPALNALAGMPPIEARRAEVAAAIEPLVTDTNPTIQRAAIMALGTWGTEQSVPALAKALTGPAPPVRWAAMDTLGKLKSAEAADIVAQRVPDTQDGTLAISALTRMGPVAEDAVIQLLGHADVFVRTRACDILEQIGGPKSVDPLEKLMEMDAHPATKAAAERALGKLRNRS